VIVFGIESVPAALRERFWERFFFWVAVRSRIVAGTDLGACGVWVHFVPAALREQIWRGSEFLACES
jgi:hypothetical protein